MKKVGCITFHASHNYGSVLQAYALQEFVKNNFNDIEYKIINLRTQRQKDIYSVFPKTASLKYKIFVLLNYSSLKAKYDRFENFINTKLSLTEEFENENINENKFDFDFYISGGDQCWNIRCTDFSWLYYLPFVKKAKKLSYAVSLGPKPLDFSSSEKEKIKFCVNSYSSLSLREEGSIEQLKNLVDRLMKKNLDPVFLLNKNEWAALAGKRIEKSSYIFLYILDEDKEAYSFAGRLSKLLKKKVIISKPIFPRKDFFHHFTNRFDSGPVEFINYICYADAVVSTSFHGCVFSSVFERPLFTLNADKDSRRKYFLEKFGLEPRNVGVSVSDEDILSLLNGCDFTKFRAEVKREQEKSLAYLKSALDEEALNA